MGPKVYVKPSGEGKGKGKAKSDGPRKANTTVLTKTRALAQIVSLTPEDDEREATSKKISWILRRGAARVNINTDANGWIKFDDLLNCELLDDMPDRSEEKLMSVIDESNGQKLRYELKDTEDGKVIRALSKEERKSKSGEKPGEKAGASTSNMQVESQSELRGDAPAFVPGQAAAASPMAGMGGYPQMPGYPGFGFSPFGFPWPYSAYGQQGYPGAYGAAAAGGGADNAKGRFNGRVKSFNQEKGYGFVESGEAYQVYGRDVFLHKAHIGDFLVGAFVTFTVEVNNQGMPQARDLVGSDGSGAAGKGKGKGKGKDGKKGDGKKGEGKGKKEKKEGDGEKNEAEGGEAKPKKERKPKKEKKEGEGDAKEGEAQAVAPGEVKAEEAAKPEEKKEEEKK